MNLNDYITTDFGHVTLNLSSGLKCAHCGMVMPVNTPRGLSAHIMQVIGFVGMHKDCKAGEPHPIFGRDYGVEKPRKK